MTMGGKMSRVKGQVGEREFIKLLEAQLDLDFERNLDQTRAGGYDIKGLEELAIEVKRQEKLNLTAWWSQAVEQAAKGQYPILAYRQSRKPWNIVIPLSLIAPKQGWSKETATVDLDTFIKIIKKRFSDKIIKKI